MRFDINLFDAGMCSTVNAILTNASYVSLLVVHSRFYCEYREAHPFKGLHPHLIQSQEGIYSSGPGPSEQDFAALARAVSATIHTRYHTGGLGLAQMLLKVALRMHTVRLLYRIEKAYASNTSLPNALDLCRTVPRDAAPHSLGGYL